MDERLAKALEFSKYKQTLYSEKKRLQEKLKSELTFPFNGGIFYADRHLIVFLNLLTPEEGTSATSILDERLTPIYVEDILVLQKKALDTYSKAVNQYQVDFANLQKMSQRPNSAGRSDAIQSIL
jgi:hypothetical protein